MTADKGYVGSALTELLLRSGCEVIGCDAEWFGNGRGAGFEDLSVDDLFGVSTVFHLAAFPDRGTCDAFPADARALNVDAAIDFALRCRDAGVRRFVYASSAAVYGLTDGPDEADDTRPRDLFGETKLEAESAIVGLRDDGFTPIALRFGSGFGMSPSTRFDLVVNKLTFKGITEGRIALGSDGAAARPFVCVDDMARAARFVDEIATAGQFDDNVAPILNVVHPEGNRSVAEVAQMIGDRLGLPVELGDIVDDASYSMDPSRLLSLGFDYRWSLERGIDRLANSLAYHRPRADMGPDRNRRISEQVSSSPTPLVTPGTLDHRARTTYTEHVASVARTNRYRVEDGWTAQATQLVADELGVRDQQDLVLLRSGTDALVRGLQLCGVGPGSSVLVPDQAFHAVAASVLQLGANPVFVDIAADDFNIDADEVYLRLSRPDGGLAFDAVIAVDNYGTPCDWRRLADICRDACVPLIVDACESLGASRDDLKVAEMADVVAVSFSFTKPVHAAGMGGALVASSEIVKQLRSDPRYLVRQTLLPEINSAYLVEAWSDLETNIARLRAIYDGYREALVPLGFQPQTEHGISTRIHAPFLLPADSPWTRDEFLAALSGSNIAAAAQFPSQAMLLGIGEPRPRSAAVTANVVSLPSGAGLEPATAHQVAADVARIYLSR